MVQIIWSSEAKADLKEIHDYIAHDSRRYAQQTVDRIQSRVGLLALAPESGQFVLGYSDREYREVVVRSHRVIFRHDEERQELKIIAVVHGSRDLPAVLDQR